MATGKQNPQHYINNAEFLVEMTAYRYEYLDYIENKETIDKPRISEKAAIAFLKIATNLATKPNFRNYTYKDEMILDGIENCIAYAHNFNPEKSSNPFSYFTQIIYYAFLRRIQREKKQTDIKRSMIKNMDITALIDCTNADNTPELREYFEGVLEVYFNEK
jgi:hypothetical protein